MKIEIDALLKIAHENWHDSPGEWALDSKWLYEIKYRAGGTIERYTARLVILGNTLQEMVDFTETLAL